MTGEVPLLIGESGIGKTSLVMEIAKELDYTTMNIPISHSPIKPLL